ncbi:MAG: DUF1549 and DUF1553 domain-containing protein [Gemmataceae bacterium]|nr:DUF1549 and DUF1553 domain-containing protein [Gemmataceae bacterium]
MRQRGLPPLSVVTGFVFFLAAVPAVRAESVSFRHEVMAVLSKAGCNQGACHGNQNGKGGFKLSLRGEDPEFDLDSLTHDMLGRRTDAIRPAASLLLVKATAAVPHEGGKRFDVDSLEYRILHRWIGEGLHGDPVKAPTLRRVDVTPTSQVLLEPVDRVQLQVRATFSDGSTRDVTRLAVYEPSGMAAFVTPEGEARRQQTGESAVLVRYLNHRATVQLAFVPARPNFVWKDVPEANFIDRHIFAKLKTLRTLPSERCSDSVFLRRAYLDLLGLAPTADEVRGFLNDARVDKRARLIDRLLERPEFADYWALKWSDVLRNEEKVLDRKGVQAFHHWIRQAIADGKPLNDFARDLIASRGSTYVHPEANFYRALRDPQARAEATAQVFLGIRLQCARCHNHPFDRWTQNDYHSLAAFFARVDYRILENNRKDRLDAHEFDGEQIVLMAREGEVKHPRSGDAMRPLFLGAPTPRFGDSADRLTALADWVARSDNPFFARTQVNRIWHHLMGHGIVDPNDDFRASNPPVNGPLLESLSKDFVEHKFDLRHTIRTIMNSRTYQLAALPNETNRDDETNFSHALVRPLQAEQLIDSFSLVIGVPVKFNGYPLGMRAAQLPGVPTFRRQRDQGPTPAEQFLKVFGKPDRLLTCECERSDDTTLNQAFQLLTGELMNEMLGAADNRIGKLLAAKKSNREIIEEFYLTALCRPPSAKELLATVALVDRATDRRAALEDVVWGLVNAKEFLLRR